MPASFSWCLRLRVGSRVAVSLHTQREYCPSRVSRVSIVGGRRGRAVSVDGGRRTPGPKADWETHCTQREGSGNQPACDSGPTVHSAIRGALVLVGGDLPPLPPGHRTLPTSATSSPKTQLRRARRSTPQSPPRSIAPPGTRRRHIGVCAIGFHRSLPGLMSASQQGLPHMRIRPVIFEDLQLCATPRFSPS